jgi:hypothetical protein
MKDIIESSRRISEITTVINGIAFRPIFWRSMPPLRLHVQATRAVGLPLLPEKFVH